MATPIASIDTHAAEGMKTYAIQGLKGSTGYLLSTLAAVPDDKLNYSPSETAKSALRIGAHIAVTNKAFASLLRGEAMPDMTMEQAIAWLNGEETRFTTREQVQAAIAESADDLATAISALSAEDLGKEVATPFGPWSVQLILQLCAGHSLCHASQIDYLQTIWGDLESHAGH
jgi:uncharacterized damage-inducible protein DinB